MSTEADIVDYLKEYHNKESKAIKGRSLCELFNLHSKQVRNLVSVLRQNGEPICSSNHPFLGLFSLSGIGAGGKQGNGHA